MSGLLQCVSGVVAAAASGAAPLPTYADVLGSALKHWWRPSLGSLNQLSTNDGDAADGADDPAGYMPDQVGSAHMTGTTTTRPLLKLGPPEYLQTDGIDDRMQSGNLSNGGTTLYLVAAVQITHGSGDDALFSVGTLPWGIEGSFLIETSASASLQLRRRNVTYGPLTRPETAFVVEAWLSATATLLSVNGTDASGAGDTNVVGEPLCFGKTIDGDNPGAARLYDCAVARGLADIPSSGDRATLRAIAAAAAGITLP